MGYSHSPLRYPGGKSHLLKYFIKLLKENNLMRASYVEPYSGGAGIAAGLLVKDVVDNVVINDADVRIFSFWKAVVENADEFIDLLMSVEVDLDTWRVQKDIYNNHLAHSRLEVGFATFFLNRCNRSGILQANPIGGLQQSGKWKIDARFHKNNLANRIREISRRKDRILVYNLDALELLYMIEGEFILDNMVVYLDPPYYNKGDLLYYNYYKPQDHQNLADYMRLGKAYRWIMTYDNCDEILNLYDGLARNTLNIKYYVHTVRDSTEVVIHDARLSLPSS